MEDYEKMASDVGFLSWVPLGIHSWRNISMIECVSQKCHTIASKPKIFYLQLVLWKPYSEAKKNPCSIIISGTSVICKIIPLSNNLGWFSFFFSFFLGIGHVTLRWGSCFCCIHHHWLPHLHGLSLVTIGVWENTLCMTFVKRSDGLTPT